MSLDEARAERLAELFEQALALSSGERQPFLDEISTEDAELGAELESLLASHEEAPDCLDALAARVLPEAVGDLSQALAAGAELPQTAGRYQLLERLGGGGMGVVYRARDPELGRLVALKFLPPHLGADGEAQARLRAEARAASVLDHPHIATVYEIGVTEPAASSPEAGRLFIAMAYYAGETLKAKIARGALPVSEALACAVQVAEGLAAAHEVGIVHRDVKPANLMVTDRGQVKIVDFGLAKLAGTDLTREGTTLGTVAYMSPEQTRGGPVDHRTDLWSLGVVLYEMLTGVRPFRGESDRTLIHAIRHDAPEPVDELRPEVPSALAAIVRTCLAKDPAARYGSAEDLLAELRVALLPTAAAAAPASAIRRRGAAAASGLRPADPRGDRPSRTRRSARVPRAAMIGIAAVLVIAGGMLLIRGERFRNPAAVAGGPAAAVSHGPLIAVLPFAPASPDSALERAGRDLVVTLSAGLDGMGEFRVADAMTTLARVPRRQALPLDEAQRMARDLAADRLVHGALIRVGDGLRLDAAIYPTGSTEPIARASLTAGHLPELSDAVTVALLDQLWQREPPRVPSLAAVTRSRVPAARRAYMAGELAMARIDMPAAIDAFERAFAEDTTFWWAYWRSLYPRTYQGTTPADPALVQKVIDHRWELAEADRRLIEVTRLSRSLSEQVTRLRLLTDQFPTYEPAWWEYADRLVHRASYLGYTLEDARSALEHVLTLNPRFAPAWDHLLWVALVQGDSAMGERAAHQAAQLVGNAATPHSRAIRHLRATLFEPGSLHAGRLDEWVEVVRSAPPGGAEALSVRLLADDFPVKQIQVNRAVRARSTSPTLSAALWRGEALAWAARGAWDSTLVAADQWVAAAGGTDADAELGAYRLAVAGVMLGAVPPVEANRRRSRAASAIARLANGSAADCDTMLLDSAAHASGRDAGGLRCEAQVRQAIYQRSDLAWLDGLLAYLANEPNGIASARRALQADPAAGGPVGRPLVSPWDSVSRPLLDRSLAALSLDAAGDRKRAAREMVAVETEIANHFALNQVGMSYPLLSTANRMIAATWLRALGEDDEAARLLNWHEAIPGRPLVRAWNRSIGALSLLDRAEIAEAMGEPERARRYYARLLVQYDLPSPPLQPRLARAEAALGQLPAPMR